MTRPPEKTKTWPSKRQPEGFCGGIFPHVFAQPGERDAGLCIFCGTPELEAVAAGDRFKPANSKDEP